MRGDRGGLDEEAVVAEVARQNDRAVFVEGVRDAAGDAVLPVDGEQAVAVDAQDEGRGGHTAQRVFDAVAVAAYPELEGVNHVHHAGNSSGIVDGAAAVLIGSKEAGKAAGLKPRAKIRAFANIGSEPAIMLTGPVDVTKKMLKRAGMSVDGIDLFEINEAFASVVLRYAQAFDLHPEIVNVNGGAISMGHPLGATGAMILGTVLDELERTDEATALVTLCIGAGMGTATIIERV